MDKGKLWDKWEGMADALVFVNERGVTVVTKRGGIIETPVRGGVDPASEALLGLLKAGVGLGAIYEITLLPVRQQESDRHHGTLVAVAVDLSARTKAVAS